MVINAALRWEKRKHLRRGADLRDPPIRRDHDPVGFVAKSASTGDKRVVDEPHEPAANGEARRRHRESFYASVSW